jgi:hypothetical protein
VIDTLVRVPTAVWYVLALVLILSALAWVDRA